jgi:hypothetical protein
VGHLHDVLECHGWHELSDRADVTLEPNEF